VASSREFRRPSGRAALPPSFTPTLARGVLLLSRITNSSTVLRRLGSGAKSLRLTWWGGGEAAGCCQAAGLGGLLLLLLLLLLPEPESTKVVGTPVASAVPTWKIVFISGLPLPCSRPMSWHQMLTSSTSATASANRAAWRAGEMGAAGVWRD
jgi:hypothetical protein